MRHKNLRANDVFLASYPRSGSTWLRFLVFEALVGESSGFNSVNQAIPDIKEQNSGLPILPDGGRLIKTHEVYHPEYHKAVYLVRDPRDVALSEYAYQTALGLVNLDLDDYLRVFLTRGVNPFASWRAHVDSWFSAPLAQDRLLIVHFEELRKNPLQGVAKIVRFLGLTPDEALIGKSIADNTVERMRAKEKETPQRASKRGRFIRSGSVGGWRANLGPEQVRLFEQHAGDALTRAGYPLSAEAPEPVTA